MPTTATMQLPRNPLLRQGHLHRGCHICDLAWTHPEVYDWSEQAILDGLLTQAEIAAELTARTGQRFDQPQVSNHRSRHLTPMLHEYRAAFAAQMASLSVFGELGPEQMAVVNAQLTSMKLQQAIDQLDASDADNAPLLAKLATAQATVDKALQTAVKTTHEVDGLQHANRQAEIAEQLAEGQYQEAFAAWVEENHPHIAALLAQEASETTHE